MVTPLHGRTTERALYLLIALLVGVVFAADILTRLGLIVWVFYLAPLALCLFTTVIALPLFVAALVSVLLAYTTYFEYGEATSIVQQFAGVNRGFGLAMFWSIAIIERQLLRSRVRLQREEWIRKGQARLMESVQGDLSTDQVGSRALEVLSELLGAQLATFYTREGELLRLAARHGVVGEVGSAAVFRLGEGLVGQAAKELKTLTVPDVPESYFHVQSGLGRLLPRHLVVAPLAAENKLLAVVELASLHPLEGIRADLLERIGEPLAIAVRSAQYRSRQRDLLEDSQRQAEELQTQQEELRVANEELEEQSRALRESQGRLQLQQAELEQINTQLEGQTRELERQSADVIKAKQHADRANRYKSEFLANMSHELRTPLNSALILARLLAENKDNNLTEDQVHYAETIYSAGNDLLALINDILDLSKIEAGKVEVRPEDVPLERLADALRHTFGPIAAQKKLAFETELAGSLPETLFTDPIRAEQVLKNLVSNALKFTESGKVTVTISQRGPDSIGFAVTDTGIGIAAEQLGVIFEAFRQADGTTNRKYGGTGLGLSISRELTHLLGGELFVESTPGKGSTFTLLLPKAWSPALVPEALRRKMEGTAPPIEPTPPGPPRSLPPPVEPARRTTSAPRREPRSSTFQDDRGQRRRPNRLILVVEDDPAFARILYDLAHELDFDCLVAGSVAEALRLVAEFKPSGILLDVGLPDGSGLSVLEQLKRSGETRHIPVHVVSAVDHAQTALELGAIGYALKPVAREKLVDAVQKLEEKLKQQVRRVLIVEDDPTLRESTRALLQSEHVEIDTVGTAEEALEQLKSRSFDCMVLDLKLPDASGYELLEQMAGQEEYAFPPVIVYTGREVDRAEEERLRRYSHSIIIKGVRSPERLLDEVTLFLHQVEAELPVDRQRMLREARQRDAAFEGRRILIVEDDVRNIFALSHLLEPRGAKVEIARNGLEALTFLEKNPNVDLVLMDIMMPEMDGLTATRKIRERPELARLPIIALTAKAMKDDQEQCLAAGANDYMAKPIDVDKLLSLCRVWMTR